jgi:thiamine biosynthesis lipoprotein
MGIDLGGIGKEYAVDQLLEMCRSFGIENVMIDIGQDIRVAGRAVGKDAWYIGLEEPEHAGECWTAVRLTDHAVATSGDYVRSFTIDGRRYGHILDPRTGLPVRNGCQAVSIIAPTCVMAGVLSTAGFILGAEQGLELIRRQGGVEGCITTQNARHQTRRFSSYVPA